MAREYRTLECGCLVSCDGGGALIVDCNEINCKVKEYMKDHIMNWGLCPICHPIKYKEEEKRNEK